MTNKVTIKLPTRLADVQMLVIEKTLIRNGGHLGNTSRDLDVSYSTLYRRLREFRKAKGQQKQDCR
jgi:DNA-binding NtrC family response regulator